MTEDQKLRVQELVEELDSLVPRTEAVVMMNVYGGRSDDGEIIATETGYLRFGIELLKAPFLSPGALPLEAAEERTVRVDLEYLVAEQSDINFYVFRLDNTLKSDVPIPAQPKQDWKDNALIAGCGLLILVLLSAAVIGFVTMGKWI